MRITVAAGGELHWLPEPLISVTGSELAVRTLVDLEPGARLVLRDELVLGRTGEGPGRLTSRLTVRVEGRPVLDQELDFGPGAPGGWDGPAVLGGHRAVGQLVVCDPEFAEKPVSPDASAEGAVVLPLAGPKAVLVSAVAPDALRLRLSSWTARPSPSPRRPSPSAPRPHDVTPTSAYRIGKEGASPLSPVTSGARILPVRIETMYGEAP